jgi:DNA recombination protein RmuC
MIYALRRRNLKRGLISFCCGGGQGFSLVLENTQKRLRQAAESVDSAYVRTRSIERHLRKVEALEEGQAKALLPEEGLEDTLLEEEA